MLDGLDLLTSSHSLLLYPPCCLILNSKDTYKNLIITSFWVFWPQGARETLLWDFNYVYKDLLVGEDPRPSVQFNLRPHTPKENSATTRPKRYLKEGILE